LTVGKIEDVDEAEVRRGKQQKILRYPKEIPAERVRDEKKTSQIEKFNACVANFSVATAPNRLLSKTRFCEPCTRSKNLEIFDKIDKTKS
jgi:hypothetical protein